MVPIYCCCNCASVGYIGMEIFSFVVLSVIIAPHNVLTPHISKAHLPIVLLNVRELELNWCSKEQSMKKGLCGGSSTLPRKALRFIDLLSRATLLYRGMLLLNGVQSKQDFCQWCMSWNELKWAKMSLNELKKAWKNLNQCKWVQMSLDELKWVEVSEGHLYVPSPHLLLWGMFPPNDDLILRILTKM